MDKRKAFIRATSGMQEESAASFDESPEERDQRRRERADKARPNVSMTPGQAETLAKSAATTQREEG